MYITENTTVSEILDFDAGAAELFFDIGMNCLGCPASRGESIAEACAVHGTDPGELVGRLNAYLDAKRAVS